MKTLRSSGGFTLVEVMIALFVFMMLTLGVTSFYIETLKISYESAQRMVLGGQLKRFSDELLVHASRANETRLYQSVDGDQGIAKDAIQLAINVSDPTNLKHPAGNFIVFVYYKIPKPTGDLMHGISKITGYYFETLTKEQNSRLRSRIRKVEITFAIPAQMTVEKAIQDNWKKITKKDDPVEVKFTDFMINIRGLYYSETLPATDANNVPSIFFKSNARGITVGGQMYKSNVENDTDDWKTYTQSFNFIVTPRS